VSAFNGGRSLLSEPPQNPQRRPPGLDSSVGIDAMERIAEGLVEVASPAGPSPWRSSATNRVAPVAGVRDRALGGPV
jgi:hypothetical protein